MIVDIALRIWGLWKYLAGKGAYSTKVLISRELPMSAFAPNPYMLGRIYWECPSSRPFTAPLHAIQSQPIYGGTVLLGTL